MKKIALHALGLLALFGCVGISTSQAAVQTIATTDASVFSGQVTTLKFTAPTGVSGPSLYLACPEGVEAQINVGASSATGQCNSSFALADGLNAASQLNVLFINRTAANQVVRADFRLQFPQTVAPTIKSLNFTVTPFVATTTTSNINSGGYVRFDFTMPPPAEVSSTVISITCPVGMTATYGTGANLVNLCNAPYSFATNLSLMDVVFKNWTDNPLSAGSEVSFSIPALPGQSFSKTLSPIVVTAPVYANTTTFTATPASVLTGSVVTLNATTTVAQGKQRVRVTCPADVRAFQLRQTGAPQQVCGTDMDLPFETRYASSSKLFLLNATSTNQTVNLAYITTKSTDPDPATWERAFAAADKAVVTVLPFITANKTEIDSNTAVVFDFTLPPAAEVSSNSITVSCPTGISALYGTGVNEVNLCNGPYAFPEALSAMSVLFKNNTDNPISVNSQVTFTTLTAPAGILVRSLPPIVVNSPLYSGNTTFSVTPASVNSGQLFSLVATSTVAQGKQRVRVTCPADVEAFQLSQTSGSQQVCGTDILLPIETHYASSSKLFIANKTSTNQTVNLAYITTKSTDPDPATWERAFAAADKAVVTARPFVATTTTSNIESGGSVTFDFTLPPAVDIVSPKLTISCPAGITATYLTGAAMVNLCAGPYAFGSLSAMSVRFTNSTDNVISVNSSVSFSPAQVPSRLISRALSPVVVNSPFYFNSTTINVVKASVKSMEVSAVNYTSSISQGMERFRFICPEGVKGFRQNKDARKSFVEVCNTDIAVPVGTTVATANSQDVFFTNATNEDKTVTVAYVTTKIADPDSATWERAATLADKDTIIVKPVLVPNKQVIESAAVLRLSFTPAGQIKSGARLEFICPQNVSAVWSGIELCVNYPSMVDENRPDTSKTPLASGGHVFRPGVANIPFVLLPAYMDVTVTNRNLTGPAYVTPRLSYTTNTSSYFSEPSVVDSLDSVAQTTVVVQSAVHFDVASIDSKDSVSLQMFFPPNTRGKVHLECPVGVSTSFVGKCNKDYIYPAVSTATALRTLNFTLANDSDEPQTVIAKVCAYPGPAATTCNEYTARVDIAQTPSILEVIIGAFNDLFNSWRPRFSEEDNTDKLLKTAVVKYDGTAGESIVITPAGATYAIVRAWGAAGGMFGNDNHSPQFSLNDVSTNWTLGGYGGFVAGKVAVEEGDYFGVNGGYPAGNGLHSGDDNDDPGQPGGKSTVSFNGQPIMVAGGGAQMLHVLSNASGGFTKETAPEGAAKRLEALRTEYSSGGFQRAGVTVVDGVTAGVRNTIVNAAKNSHAAPGMATGGGGATTGAWYVWKRPSGTYPYEAILTGGSSYITDSTVDGQPIVSNPTYFQGHPGKNVDDSGAWEKYFTEKKIALPFQQGRGGVSGAGAVVIEFWGPSDVVIVCEGLPSDDDDCPTLALTASPLTIPLGQQSSLGWLSTKATSCSASTASVGAGSWSGTVALNGTQSVTPTATGTMVYDATCVGESGSITRTVSVQVIEPVTCLSSGSCPVNATITAVPASIELGESAAIFWASTNADRCVALMASPGAGSWSGTLALNGSQPVTPTASGTMTYQLKCFMGSDAAVTKTAVLNVEGLPVLPPLPDPTVSLTASSLSVVRNQAVTLSWASTDATSCSASAPAGGGSWSGSVGLGGARSVTPTETGAIRYSVTCLGESGSASASLVVNVVDDPDPLLPSVTIDASPRSIRLGESATVSWAASNAEVCVAWNQSDVTGSGFWPGLRPVSGGSVAVTPTIVGSHTYHMDCSNSLGTASAPVTVTVTPVTPPSVAAVLTASASSVVRGVPFSLTWESTNATSCSASSLAGSGAWSGAVALDGTQSVTSSLVGPVSYQLTCSGASGSLTRTATVEVLPPPQPPLPTVYVGSDPFLIRLGEETTISWTTSNASSCAAWSPSLGAGAWFGLKPTGTGSLSVTPVVAGDHTYHMTCSNSAGQSASGRTIVKVNPGTQPPVCSNGATNWPECTLAPVVTASLVASPAGIALTEGTTLTWSSANATSCSASTASVGAGSWSGTVATSGAMLLIPSATGTKAYDITCAGAVGVTPASSSATVVVSGCANGSVLPGCALAPTLSVSASPSSVAPGAPVTLSWASTNATSCSASTASVGAGSWSGPLGGLVGTKAVNPSTLGTKAYAVTCLGAAGSSVTRTVSVQVTDDPEPSCDNGATNPPLCTRDTSGGCLNGATNPPLCTTTGNPLVCVNGAIDPPACTSSTQALSIMTSSGSLGLKFVGTLPATSEFVTISVGRIGFTGPVTLSVPSLYPTMPSGNGDVQIGYNFGSASGPDTITIPAGESSTTFRVRVSKKISDACATATSSGCTPYEIRIRASAAGGLSAQTSLRLNMASIRPIFEEQ